MKKNDKQEAGFDFETALAELEAIVKELEAGNLNLDKSLELFERGIEMARLCKERLDAAELRVAKLVKEREGLFRELPLTEQKGVSDDRNL